MKKYKVTVLVNNPVIDEEPYLGTNEDTVVSVEEVKE